MLRGCNAPVFEEKVALFRTNRDGAKTRGGRQRIA
jgi:hypothetical protein